MSETERLRKFARRVMQAWPEGDVDGGELQEAAIACGLLQMKRPAPTKPCGEFCACADYYSNDEFAEGEVQCYMRTSILLGEGNK